MKKILHLVIISLFSLVLISCANSEEETQEENLTKWEHSVTVAKATIVNEYVITYSDEKVVPTSEILTLENTNDFWVVVYLKDGKNQRVESLEPGQKIVLYEMGQGVQYTLGIHVDDTNATEVALWVYDGALNISEKKEPKKEPITPKEAIAIAQECVGGPLLDTVLNYENPNIAGIVYDELLDITAHRNYMYYINKFLASGREVYRITFNTEQDGLLGPIVLYVDKYRGTLLGADARM